MENSDVPALLSAIVEAAKAIGATVEAAPVQLTEFRFNAEVLSDAGAAGSARRQSTDLPGTVAAVIIDKFPVLVGVLTDESSRAALGSQLRRYRNQATIARSWLGPQAPNLHLFLGAPLGSSASVLWRQLASEIETDDRVCRKLVWLPDEAFTVESATYFLERTFVARPWPALQRSERLDTMTSLALPTEWEEAVQDPELDSSALVERLIELQRDSV